MIDVSDEDFNHLNIKLEPDLIDIIIVYANVVDNDVDADFRIEDKRKTSNSGGSNLLLNNNK